MLSFKLKIAIVVIATLIALITANLQRKYKISVRYTMIWYLTFIILIMVSCFTSFFNEISTFVGFEISSNFLIAVFIMIFIIMTLSFTVMISNLKQKIIVLTQELAILEKKVEELKK